MIMCRLVPISINPVKVIEKGKNKTRVVCSSGFFSVLQHSISIQKSRGANLENTGFPRVSLGVFSDVFPTYPPVI